MSKVNIVLDATMLDTMMLCPAKYNYRFNLNKVTVAKAKPLDQGGLVHLSLEAFYNGIKDGKHFNDCVGDAIKAIQIGWTTDSELSPEEYSRIVEVLYEYFDRWKLDDQRFEIIAVETPFSYVLFEDDAIRIVMTGKIDLLVNEGTYKGLPYDHKTYSRDYPVRRKVNQFSNYAYATGSNYLIVNKIGFQTSVKPEIKHKRIPLSYDPLYFNQWKSNVVRWCHMYLDFIGLDEWPMNDTSCDKFNRVCEYYDVCDTSGEESKIFKLNTNFKTDTPWDITKAHGSKNDE